MAIPSPLSYAVVYFLLPLSALLPLILFGSSTGTNNWLVPPDRAEFEPIVNITGMPISIFVPSNGRLGMQYFCPNTAPASIFLHYAETGEILTDKEIPKAPCYWMEPTCDITYCIYNDTANGALGLCTKFDIFDPQLPDDTGSGTIDKGLLAMYNIIKGFPGGGSCAAYRSSKWFHYFSFTCAVLAMIFTLGIMALFPIAKIIGKLQEVMALCAAGAGTMHLLAFLFSIITLSVWGGSVTNPAISGSFQGSGFWVEVSACIAVLFCAPVPFLVTSCELPEPDRDDVEERYVQEMMGTNKVSVPTTNSDAERLEKELKQVVMDRDSKASQLAALQQEMGVKGAELETLRAEVKAMGIKDAELETLREEVRAKDARIATLSEELVAVRKGTVV